MNCRAFGGRFCVASQCLALRRSFSPREDDKTNRLRYSHAQRLERFYLEVQRHAPVNDGPIALAVDSIAAGLAVDQCKSFPGEGD